MSSSSFKIYTSDELIVSVGAIIIEDGLPKGGFFKVGNPEQFGHVSGLDGHVARYRKRDRVRICELTLMQTSRHHAELASLLLLDSASGNGAGVVPFFASDPNGTMLYVSEYAWITKAADSDFGEEVKDASPWMISFVADNAQAFPAGA